VTCWDVREITKTASVAGTERRSLKAIRGQVVYGFMCECKRRSKEARKEALLMIQMKGGSNQGGGSEMLRTFWILDVFIK
jgi:hypothetical protein